MDSSESPKSMDEIVDVIGPFRRRGVQLWVEDGQLRYKARKGALTREDLDCLRASRDEIVAALAKSNGARLTDQQAGSREQDYRAPLAFSQVAHWHLYELSQRPSFRGIACAMRLHGRLNVDTLRRSATEMVRRHEALRTQIVLLDGMLVQFIAIPRNYRSLQAADLLAFSESIRENEVMSSVERHILEPIDLSIDAPFGARLLRLRDDEHVLIVSMDHIISDASSMNILLRDLFTAYGQVSAGAPVSLPPVSVQFAGYARSQNDRLPLWIEKHGTYWKKHFAGCRLVRLAVNEHFPSPVHGGWSMTPLEIGPALKTKLREWSRLRRTTLAMAVFTAYVGLVLRWCKTAENVIQYVTSGRTSSAVENTIGYFASTLFLRMELLDNDTFVDLLRRVTEEYCKAYEHADSSYTAAQMPRSELTFGCVFNWVPQPLSLEVDAPNAAITCQPIPFANPALRLCEWDSDPHLVLSDASETIVGGIYFPASRFSISAMERFGRDFLTFLGELVAQTNGRVKDIPVQT